MPPKQSVIAVLLVKTSVLKPNGGQHSTLLNLVFVVVELHNKMLKIITNHNKQDITYTYTIGQTFPDIQGKLLQLELSGKELAKLVREKEIPICAIDTSCLTWQGRGAGSVLKLLKEIFNV